MATSKTTKAATKAAPAKPAAAKKAGAKAPPKAAGAAKKAAAPVAKAAEKKAKAGAGKAGKASISHDQRRHYIEVAAYYIAERRGFCGGSELEDWVCAESEVDRLLREGLLGLG